jgi:hypothetical protein
MIFVDESIQQNLGYICVGFAYCEEPPDEAINRAIAEAGLIPGADEYKSGYRMVGSDARHSLRESIYQLVQSHCKLGIYIAPLGDRERLLSSVVEVASKIVQVNSLNAPQDLFVDEGIGGGYIPAESVRVTHSCDSRRVPGVQLADFIAYHCSYLLKGKMLGETKIILMGQDEPHPLAGEEVELDWILRTDFRRHFFVEPRNVEEIKGDDWFFKLAGYGAFFAPSFRESVKAAAERTFDSMYFGCVW